MKGIVFTEFIEMVEDTFSPDIADYIIEASDLESGGVYTSIGTYDHSEMLQLVTHLSEKVEMPIPELVRAFGRYLFGRFADGYPQFFEGIDSVFPFLGKIEDYIHVEVRKLYPDAELPGFEYDTTTENKLVLTYRSQRPFADLAEGLITGCIEHFKEELKLERENLNDTGTAARFTLIKQN